MACFASLGLVAPCCSQLTTLFAMATDLVMPSLPAEQQYAPHVRLPFVARPQHARTRSYQLPSASQISPLSTSDGTLSNKPGSNPGTGPSTSPVNGGHSPSSSKGRVVKPLYMPAVLRPNEFPTRSARSKPGSPTGLGNEASYGDAEPSMTSLRRSSSSLMGMAGLNVLGQRLGRRPNGPGCNGLTDDFDLKMFPSVTALPRRDHWKPDAESSICDDPTCKRSFNYFVRRHHCRKCGNIFCDWHSSYVAPLDQDANFNPRANPSRTCSHCFDMFRAWHSRNNSQASSSASSGMPHTTPSTPVSAGPGAANGLPHGPEVAASVPRDWNWSTF